VSSTENTAVIILRFSLAALFLRAAWACGKNREARQWTESETALLFPTNTRFFALGGIAIMGIGGASILLGFFTRLGALALTGFVITGARIHLIQRQRAFQLEQSVERSVPATDGGGVDRKTLSELAVSASLAHYSSALKNYALAGATAYLVLFGPGDWALVDFGSDFGLAGWLIRRL
jgi:uncharacterized membrane protein YphA (DoxX/SURF4 family)